VGKQSGFCRFAGLRALSFNVVLVNSPQFTKKRNPASINYILNVRLHYLVHNVNFIFLNTSHECRQWS